MGGTIIDWCEMCGMQIDVDPLIEHEAILCDDCQEEFDEKSLEEKFEFLNKKYN